MKLSRVFFCIKFCLFSIPSALKVDDTFCNFDPFFCATNIPMSQNVYKPSVNYTCFSNYNNKKNVTLPLSLTNKVHTASERARKCMEKITNIIIIVNQLFVQHNSYRVWLKIPNETWWWRRASCGRRRRLFQRKFFSVNGNAMKHFSMNKLKDLNSHHFKSTTLLEVYNNFHMWKTHFCKKNSFMFSLKISFKTLT